MSVEILCRRTAEANEQQVRSAMEEQQHSNAARHLQVIYTDITHRVGAITAVRPIWPCHKGCDGCCRRPAQPLAMTAAEWQAVYQGFLQLSPTT